MNQPPGNGSDDESIPELKPVTPGRTADDVLRELESEPEPEESFVTAPPAPAPRPTGSRPVTPAPPSQDVVTPPAPVDDTIGRCLLAEGPITREFLRQQLAVSGKGDTYVGQLLAGTRAAAENDLHRLLAADYTIPNIDLRKCKLQANIALSLPREVALKYHVLAIDQIGDLLCVAFADTPNPKAFEAVRRATGLKLKAFRASKPLVIALLRRLYSMTAGPPQPKQPPDES